MAQHTHEDGTRRARLAGRPTIGLLTHGAGDPNDQQIWAGVEAVARQRDANLICFPGKPLASPHGFEAQANAIYDLVSAEMLDGLVIWTGVLSHRVGLAETVAFCRRFRDLPVVTIGRPLLEGLPGVVLDDYQGMRDVITHLVEYHNLTRIAFVRGPALQPEAEQRYRAYLDVMAEHGIPVDPALVASGNFKENGGAAAVNWLLDERQVIFEGLVAASDNMALGAMKALQHRGYHIPADFAIAGFNDEAQSRIISPSLTTAPFRSNAMARRATEMLLAQLNGGPPAQQVALPTRLLVRQSCGCPDQLVDEAKAVPLIVTERRVPASPGDRRDLLVVNMTAAWEPPLETPPTEEIKRVVDAFLAETTEGQGGQFLTALGGVLQGMIRRGEGLSRWQAALSMLRREMVSPLRDRSSLVRAENLLQQARVMIGEEGARAAAFHAHEAESETELLAEVLQALSNAVALNDLEAALHESLPRLQIPACHIFLYEPGLPQRAARLIISFDEAQGAAATDFPCAAFPLTRLAPPGVLPQARSYSLVAMPLYFRTEQLGYALIAAGSDQEATCEVLREQIAGALKRAHLYQEATEARQLAEAQRIVAQEGRRLAEEANSLKTRFLATVSHELRTPLSLIVGTVDLMLRSRAADAVLPASFERDLGTIRTGAQHLAHLIGDVLDLTSSQVGELRLRSAPVSMTAVLSKAAVVGEHLARDKGLEWRVETPAVLPYVMGDQTRLEQVVLNLISNAVKFTERGAVSLAAQVADGITVSVSDTGMGVPTEQQALIFDEFRQSQRSTQRGYGGMGLGLAISRRLVELHGGAITVASSGIDGEGSTFSFTLPIASNAVEADDALSAAEDTVLLLARRGSSRVIAKQLRERGYRALEQSLEPSPGWLEQVRAARADAILLELDEADEACWSIVQQLREDPATTHIPVMFYTLSDDGTSGNLLRLDYMNKPISGVELAEALMRQGVDEVAAKRRPVILIVDDDPCMLDLHARMAQSHLPDCLVLRAHNGRIGLDILAHTRPDLVLLDLMMPEVDGFQMLEAMRGSEAMRTIPVIVLTARVLTAEDMARLHVGVNAVLSKGVFTGAEVVAQMEEALARGKRPLRESQALARAVMAHIHAHYAEPLTAADLAAQVGLSERHLNRCFRQETGMTPLKYLTRYRIKQAKSLFDAGRSNVTEVAGSVGFADSGYFARVFREEVGMTPGAYLRLGENPAG